MFSTVLGFSINLGVFTLGFSKYWGFQRSFGLFDYFGVFILGFSMRGTYYGCILWPTRLLDFRRHRCCSLASSLPGWRVLCIWTPLYKRNWWRTRGEKKPCFGVFDRFGLFDYSWGFHFGVFKILGFSAQYWVFRLFWGFQIGFFNFWVFQPARSLFAPDRFKIKF